MSKVRQELLTKAISGDYEAAVSLNSEELRLYQEFVRASRQVGVTGLRAMQKNSSKLNGRFK